MNLLRPIGIKTKSVLKSISKIPSSIAPIKNSRKLIMSTLGVLAFNYLAAQTPKSNNTFLTDTNTQKKTITIKNHDTIWDYKLVDGTKWFTKKKTSDGWIEMSDKTCPDYNLAKQRLEKFMTQGSRWKKKAKPNKTISDIKKVPISIENDNNKLEQQINPKNPPDNLDDSLSNTKMKFYNDHEFFVETINTVKQTRDSLQKTLLQSMRGMRLAMEQKIINTLNITEFPCTISWKQLSEIQFNSQYRDSPVTIIKPNGEITDHIFWNILNSGTGNRIQITQNHDENEHEHEHDDHNHDLDNEHQHDNHEEGCNSLLHPIPLFATHIHEPSVASVSNFSKNNEEHGESFQNMTFSLAKEWEMFDKHFNFESQTGHSIISDQNGTDNLSNKMNNIFTHRMEINPPELPFIAKLRDNLNILV